MTEGRAGSAVAGLRLSVTMLTVLPIRANRADRPAAAVAMSVAPAIGALLGLVLGGVLWLFREAHAPALVSAGITLGAAALLTRGMHLDGLADTIDALGSYRRGDEALAIMKKPDIGPFGVAALAVVLLTQAGALTTLTPLAVVIAYAAGRLAIPLACRRGVPAARPDGLGALVAGSVPTSIAAVATLLVAAAAITATPDRPWQGPAAVVVAALAALTLTHHCVRRFGGMTGDVLGAAVELATTVTLIGLSVS